MGERLLIAFIPQKRVVKNLDKVRKLAKIKIEANSGLKTPHITLIDNSYSSVEEVDKILKGISKSTNPFIAKLEGLATFSVNQKLKIKKYEQNNSLIYMIEKNNSMKDFREKLLAKLSRLNTEERFKQWIKENPKISQEGLTNVKKYGTPFGLEEWRFHITIGLIPKEKQNEILKKINKLNLQNSWKIDCIGLFVRKKSWVLYKKYSFQKNT